MFSQTVEYALRAMTVLATHAPRSMTTEQIALATRVPPAYLSKVLQSLRKADILASRRGIGGGVVMKDLPAQVTVLDIINAVDPIRRITSCPLDIAAHGMRLCPLHSRLDAALESVEEVFASTTLDEIVTPPRKRDRTCRFPRNRMERPAGR